MSPIHWLTRLKRYHKRLNGSTIEYDLSTYRDMVTRIRCQQQQLIESTDADLSRAAAALAGQPRAGQPLDELLVPVFALVAESIRRVLDLQPFDEQLIGAIVLHQGRLAEMQTGEGKTLTAVFAACLNALSGRGVHVLTFNDYLARRDCAWMGPVYRLLGLRVGCIQEGMSREDRQAAYRADVTYLTAREAGFDYLRDSLCESPDETVLRPFHFAIIDEADSILIDEARVPLIIAGAGDGGASDAAFPDHLATLTRLARELRRSADFDCDEYGRNIFLTDQGLNRVEQSLRRGNLFEEDNCQTLGQLYHALHAEHLLVRDKDYIVRGGRVELVDEFTGRVADKRRWPDGLQAAVEAKESLAIQSRGSILNSIALQFFLLMYPRLSGMTATAQIAEEELREFYNLHVVVIPPHRPCIREDLPDVIFPTRQAKQRALIAEIARVHATRRPILIGTCSVAESAALAEALQEAGISCEVLNAKRDEHEARIISQAGRPGAVTISTNMAGRGTDIRLGVDSRERQEVLAKGGLYVIGTNRHESRRIDNQLRGRAGRQGDPGSSRFFISLEDDLFVKYRLQELLPQPPAGEADGWFDNAVVRREVDRLQRIVEGQNLEIKITLCKYGTLLEQQRRMIFAMRRRILDGEGVLSFFRTQAGDHFDQLQKAAGQNRLLQAAVSISLFQLDRHWSHYLAEMNEVREGIHLRRIGGQNPLYEFQKTALELFDQLRENIDRDRVDGFRRLAAGGAGLDLQAAGVRRPSATWTYLINDKPFEHKLEIELAANVGLSVGSFMTWPLLMLYPLLRRWGARSRRR